MRKKKEPFSFSSFLLGGCCTKEGLFVSDIFSFSDKQLETNHRYIQYLFPGRMHSLYNLSAPVLTDWELTKIRENSACTDQIRHAVSLMVGFWERKTNWKEGVDHNYLRISRCARFLGEVGGMDEELSCLSSLTGRLCSERSVSENTRKVWSDVGLKT